MAPLDTFPAADPSSHEPGSTPMSPLQHSNEARNFPVDESVESPIEFRAERIRDGSRETRETRFAAEPGQALAAALKHDSHRLKGEFDRLNGIFGRNILNGRHTEASDLNRAEPLI
jgi:hypothetical protein